MRDWTATDQDGEEIDLNNLSTQKWLEGQEVGAESAVEWLMTEATTLFRSRVEDAMKLRTLSEKMAKELLPYLKRRAEDHAKDYPFRTSEEATHDTDTKA